MKALLILITSLFFLASCVSAPKKIESNLLIGQSLTAHRYADIYFSMQPSQNDYAELKTQGFKTVINLRPEEEYDEKAEADLLKKINVSYVNVPFPSQRPLDDTLIDKITKEVVKARSKGKVLVHCSSGNRVGVWLAGHFHKDHKHSKSDSMAVAKKLGLNKPGAIEKAQTYLNTK